MLNATGLPSIGSAAQSFTSRPSAIFMRAMAFWASSDAALTCGCATREPGAGSVCNGASAADAARDTRPIEQSESRRAKSRGMAKEGDEPTGEKESNDGAGREQARVLFEP